MSDRKNSSSFMSKDHCKGAGGNKISEEWRGISEWRELENSKYKILNYKMYRRKSDGIKYIWCWFRQRFLNDNTKRMILKRKDK